MDPGTGGGLEVAVTKDRSSAPTPVVNGPTKHSKIWPLEFYRSAVGKKWVMAITGLIGVGFVVTHMIGNLKVYMGADDLNHYGEFLRELLYPLVPRTATLWIMRFALIGAVLLHLHAAYSLTVMNHRARPTDYAGGRDYVAASFASRTMRWSGIIVGAFIVFHLLDLTGGQTNPDFVRGDPYNNLVASFERPAVAAFYVIANVLLGIHLFHGVWSMFQSLGINSPRFNVWRLRIAQLIALAIVVGNVSFPLAVTFGVVEAEPVERVKVCVEREELVSSGACRDAANEAGAEALVEEDH
jgi:succinate dehydrogenase / fumarate reductase cytochrome b subunit